MGNRIEKRYTSYTGGSPTSVKSTYYVRDAQGNVLSTYIRENNDVYSQDEISMYGSSRLGVVNANKMLYSQATGSVPPSNNPVNQYIGQKQYELTNHLGNVMATISDKPIGVDINSDFENDYYEPVVLSGQDYYAFGSLKPGRMKTSGDYNYGFNGKENDNEVKGSGNSYSFEFREYDSRIGRFNTIDPLTWQYPWQSPYVFAANNPILFVDIMGLGPGDPVKKEEVNGPAGTTAPNDGTRQGDGSIKGGESVCLKCGENGEDIWGLPNAVQPTTNETKPSSPPATDGKDGDWYGEGVNWNDVNTGLKVAEGVGVGAAIGRDLAIDFRMSRPLMNRVGMSANMKTISGLGTASKWLGVTGYGAAIVGTGLDINAYRNDQLSGARLSYNTLGTAVAVGVGIGAGAVPGAVAGGAFYIGQQLYDGYNWWASQMSLYLTNFESGLKKGWVPGR